jgi:hypothetical protein
MTELIALLPAIVIVFWMLRHESDCWNSFVELTRDLCLNLFQFFTKHEVVHSEMIFGVLELKLAHGKDLKLAGDSSEDFLRIMMSFRLFPLMM